MRIVVSSATRNAGSYTCVSTGSAGCREITAPRWAHAWAGEPRPARWHPANQPAHPDHSNRESPACMSQSTTPYRSSVLAEFRRAITNVAVPHHEPPGIVRRRRVVVGVTLVIGAVMLGFSLRRTPGESSFTG